MSIGRVPGDTGIQPSIVDAKGDIIAATAADSVSRLAVGTNNQVLMADSTQATGLKYANEATATLTTTGDLLYASAANTPARLGIGSTSQVLTVSGGVPTWATPASGGGMTLLDSGSFTGASVTTATLSTSYNDLYVVVRNFQPVSNARLQVRFNGDSAANYSDNGIDYDSYAYSQTQHNEVGMIQLSSNTTSLITFNVPDYANTSTYKILFVPSAVVANVTTPANAQYTAGRISAWKSTAAVTSLTFFCSTGNFTAGTYRVYGVK